MLHTTPGTVRLIAYPHILSIEKDRIDRAVPAGSTVAEHLHALGWACAAEQECMRPPIATASRTGLHSTLLDLQLGTRRLSEKLARARLRVQEERGVYELG